MSKKVEIESPNQCPYKKMYDDVCICNYVNSRQYGYLLICQSETAFNNCPLPDGEENKPVVEQKPVVEVTVIDTEEAAKNELERCAAIIKSKQPPKDIKADSDSLHCVTPPMMEEQAVPVSVPKYVTSDGVVVVDEKVANHKIMNSRQQNWTDEETSILQMCKTLDEAREKYYDRFGVVRSADSIRHKYNALDRAKKLLRIGCKVVCVKKNSVYCGEVGILQSLTDSKTRGIILFSKNVTVSMPLVDLELRE